MRLIRGRGKQIAGGTGWAGQAIGTLYSSPPVDPAAGGIIAAGALKIRVVRSGHPGDRFLRFFFFCSSFVGVHHPVGLPHILIEGGVAAPAFRVADADRQGNGEGSAFVVRGQAFVDFVDVGVKLPLVDVLIDDAEFLIPADPGRQAAAVDAGSSSTRQSP